MAQAAPGRHRHPVQPPIPGNENAVTKVIDNLFRQGVEVIHSGVSDVHATGHAKAEELKTLPVDWSSPSGSSRCTASTTTWSPTPGSAEIMGTPARQHRDRRGRRPRWCSTTTACERSGRVPADYIYVHGTVGDIGTGVLADRRILADDGVVAITVCVDRKARKLVAGPAGHHPGLDLREGVGRPPGRPSQAGDGGGGVGAVRRCRSGSHREGRPQGGRQLRGRQDPAPADDRPGRARRLTDGQDRAPTCPAERRKSLGRTWPAVTPSGHTGDAFA